MLVQELEKDAVLLFTTGARVPDDSTQTSIRKSTKCHTNPFHLQRTRYLLLAASKNKWEFTANDHFNAKKKTQPRSLSKLIQGKETWKFVCNNYHLHKCSVNYLNDAHSPF